MKIIEVLYLPQSNNDYIDRLNAFLQEGQLGKVTTAMLNTVIKYSDNANPISRPMIVFDYDSNSDKQKCFCFSSPKPNDNPNKLEYYYLPNGTRLVLFAPTLIPTRYLKEINFKELSQNSTNYNFRKWLSETHKDFEMAKAYSKLILSQYRAIKYCIDNTDSRIVRAHDKMIDEAKVERFCKQELKLIQEKEQEHL